jgi:hypothetical protein
VLFYLEHRQQIAQTCVGLAERYRRLGATMPQSPNTEKFNSSPLPPGQYGELGDDMKASWEWLLRLLDETERRNHLPQENRFELPVRERMRRAS